MESQQKNEEKLLQLPKEKEERILKRKKKNTDCSLNCKNNMKHF